VLGDLFGALRVGVLEGRALAPQDDERAPRVAVVNARFAREFFPGESPLGRRIAWRDWLDWRADAPAWMTIVGVAADVKSTSLRDEDAPAVYTPYVQRTQSWLRFGTLVVKARGEAAPLLPSVHAALREVDPALPLAAAMTLEERVGRALSEPRFLASGASVFGVAALGLALQGLFALLAFVVAERRPEIGVRMALGATSGNVLALVLRQGAGLTALGMALGALGALGLETGMASLLFEVKPADPITYAVVALAFGATALLAIVLPACRAARTDPVEALRAG
jgi:putative ABC transport system permease protein